MKPYRFSAFSAPKVGILALQGAVREHAEALAGLGAEPVEVRTPADLERVDMLVLPGGESTAMSVLLETSGLLSPLGRRLREGMPAFGTCAGMILLANDVLDGRPDQHYLGGIDIAVRRNAFGRQVDSFETDLAVAGLDRPFHAVFIRAPVVERVGPDVEVLATVAGSAGAESDRAESDRAESDRAESDRAESDRAERPVLCRQGPVLVAAFHPELSGDPRLHQLFLDAALNAGEPASAGAPDGHSDYTRSN